MLSIEVLCIGKLPKTSAYHSLIQDYLKRLPWPLQIKEIGHISHNSANIATLETEKILGQLPQAKGNHVWVLERNGTAFSSTALAHNLQNLQDQGLRTLSILIGGSQGFDLDILPPNSKLISFGPMIWPHKLARLMLIEQLYRAYTILENHPYHKET